MLWRIIELARGVTWRLSRRNRQKYKPQMEQRSTGGMTSSNVSKWYRNALIENTIFGTPINAFRYHFDWKMSKQIKDVSFLTMASNSAHKGKHKIQFLTYSCNVQRAVEVKLSLKRKRESEKRRELDKRHLMHVIILLNTLNIQANLSVQTVVNRPENRGRIKSCCYFS